MTREDAAMTHARAAAVKRENVRRLEILARVHGPNSGRKLGDWCECSRCSMQPAYIWAASWRPEVTPQ